MKDLEFNKINFKNLLSFLALGSSGNGLQSSKLFERNYYKLWHLKK